PQRGHSPPYTDGGGIVLAVLGPLARSAADLDLALDVLAGPDEIEGVGYRLALPPPRHQTLADHRILLIDSHPMAQADDELRAGLEGLAGRLEALGAKVARSSELLPDQAETQGNYMALLQAAMARGNPSAPSITAAEWMNLLDVQVAFRRRLKTLFESFDLVLTFVHGTAAFPHDDNPEMGARTIELNGEPTPYFAQLAWIGLATFGNLPATVAPLGQTRAGLPFGVQIVGPYLEDRTTIGFARLLEREFGGFRPPPGF
ncbi:amidase family protein, partial [Phenylobacterium sp.]|uniref:amidase family protein n=1 Tax=Phenylobacterium sp. TaxID=1871053 RepID=UPI002C625A9D